MPTATKNKEMVIKEDSKITELSLYGLYKDEEKCLYLNDNKHLKNESFLKLVRDLSIKIQLDLFT